MMKTKLKNYDKAIIPAMWGRTNRTLKTIGMVKEERLRVKNKRRAANGLKPLTSYAQL